MSNHVRLKIPVQVSSNADIHQARALCLEAAAECGRVLKDPQPVCLLLGFANGSVDFELRVWIDDPRNGTVNVKSDVLVRIWDKFRVNGIEISYPQREVYLRTPVEVKGLAG